MIEGRGQVLAARYVLERRLGAGGDSEAWLARDRESGTERVLRILSAGATPEVRGRFLARAELQRSLNHVNVLPCLEARDDDPAFSVHPVATGTLAELRGAAPQKVFDVLAAVAAGLGAVHRRGWVHGDLKPSNVLLAGDDRVQLSDFGSAARIGEAFPRGNSPFAASPEQLAGAGATVADDVYSFGALAWELLTGYPPFYPDASAARDAPAPPVAPPASSTWPGGLEALLLRCLARSAAARPRNMDEVCEALGRCAQAPTSRSTGPARPAVALRLPEQAAPAIQPSWRRTAAPGPTAEELRTQGFRRGLLVGSFVFLLVIAGLVFFALPRWVTPEGGAPVAADRPAPQAAATATGPKTSAAAAGSLEERAAEETRREEVARDAAVREAATRLKSSLAAGAAALAAGNAAEAQRQYSGALEIDPNNAAARHGLARAKTLDQVRSLLAQAAGYERNGNVAAAERAYQQALQLDPETTAARDGLARQKNRAAAAAFTAAISEAMSSMARRDYPAARAAYEKAGRIRPGAQEVQDGLAEAQRGLDERMIEKHLAAARQDEASERWKDALAEYHAALATDGKLLDAQQGVARVEPRVMLDAALASYLERPERLFSNDVRGAARASLAQASAVPDPGPLLTRQVTELRRLIAAAETPVHVSIASDSRTDVTIYRVGRLGAFERKDMDLLPGRYTVVGTRAGYRDVRREITILPGKTPDPLVIRCEEPI
jgi:cytochrome c-type biogenesis protein CcmH/NrfG